jgi:cell filamentation protein
MAVLVRAAGTAGIDTELDGVLYLGRLHHQTAAPYNHNPRATMSHLIEIDLGKGRIKDLFGSQLSRALKKGATKPDVGDEIGAILVGRRPLPRDPSRPGHARYENIYLVERRSYFEKAFGLTPSSPADTSQRPVSDKPQSAAVMVSKFVERLAGTRESPSKHPPKVRAQPEAPDTGQRAANTPATSAPINPAFDTPEQLVLARVKELAKSPTPPKLDENHLKEINRRLLRDLSPDAGEYRRFNFTAAKNVVTLKAAPFDQLEGRAEHIFKRLAAQDHLKGLAKTEFVEGLARHFDELNRWSPFSRGNAPTTMVYLNQLAENAGYHLNLFEVDRDRLRRAVSIAALKQDRTQLSELLMDAVTPHRAVAFAESIRTKRRDEALARYPELQHAFGIVDQMRGSSRREQEYVEKRVQRQLKAGRLTTAPTTNAVTRLTAQSRAHAP